MNAAEQISPATEALTWAEICSRHPDEWVLLVDAEIDAEGTIRSGRLVGHHRSMLSAVERVTCWDQHDFVVYAHTRGRRPRVPRIEMTDEILDLV